MQILDVCTQVLPKYWDVKELVLFLSQPVLDPSVALGLYVKIGPTGEWLYRGCVHMSQPSELLPLQVCLHGWRGKWLGNVYAEHPQAQLQCGIFIKREQLSLGVSCCSIVLLLLKMQLACC